MSNPTLGSSTRVLVMPVRRRVTRVRLQDMTSKKSGESVLMYSIVLWASGRRLMTTRMNDQDVLTGVAAVLVTLCTVLLSLPTLAVRLNRAKLLSGGYGLVDGRHEDEDGVSTEESVSAYSDLRPRIAAWLSVAVGLGASTCSRILAVESDPPPDSAHDLWTLVVAWCGVVSWVSGSIYR